MRLSTCTAFASAHTTSDVSAIDKRHRRLPHVTPASYSGHKISLQKGSDFRHLESTYRKRYLPSVTSSGYPVAFVKKTSSVPSNPTLGFAMQSKTGSLMLALGALIAVIGLVIIPAGLGQDSAD